MTGGLALDADPQRGRDRYQGVDPWAPSPINRARRRFGRTRTATWTRSPARRGS